MPKPTTAKIINGTLGNDTLYGDDVKNGTFQGAGQTINGLGGNDILYGDISIMNGKAHGGNDSLNGGDGNDTLYGDAQRCPTVPTAVTIPQRRGRRELRLRRCLRDAPKQRGR